MENRDGQKPPVVGPEEGRFRIITKLESGGIADVYLGVQVDDTAFERLAVIKKIRASGPHAQQVLDRFLDQAQAVTFLNHPHVVKVYNLSLVRKSVCITMEYIDGENLLFALDWLRKKGQAVPLRVVCRLILQACEALQYVHTATSADGRSLNIIHGEIDPKSLMLDRNGSLKIINFGVAQAASSAKITAPTSAKSRLSYSAPETFSDSPGDARIDIYSLGIVFHQLITGVDPYPFKTDANLKEVIGRICNEHLPPATSINKNLPLAVDALIAKATAKDPEDRFQTAHGFAEAVRKFAQTEFGLAISTPEEVRNWFHETFEQRYRQRRKFEKKVFLKARVIAEKEAAGEIINTTSLVPEPHVKPGPPKIRLPHALPSISALPPRPVQVSAKPSVPVPRPSRKRRKPAKNDDIKRYVIPGLRAMGAGVLIAVGIILFYRCEPEKPAVDADSPVVTAPAPGPPEPAVVPTVVDGGSPADASVTQPEETDHTFDFTSSEAAAKVANTAIKTSPPTRPVKKAQTAPPAVRKAGQKPLQRPGAEPAPPKKTEPQPPVQETGNSTWFSADGDWSGAKVAAIGCTKCHRTGVNLYSRDEAQWADFFKKGEHNRHVILTNYFSKKELGRVFKYMVVKLRKKQQQAEN